MVKKQYNYYDELVSLANHSCEAAGLLIDLLIDYNPQILILNIEKMQQIKDNCQQKLSLMSQLLIKEFITPIEREDIIALAHKIDEINDSIEDIIISFYVFNIKRINNDALKMACLVEKCCQSLEKLLGGLRNYRKFNSLFKDMHYLRRLVQECSRVSIEASHRLYTADIQAISWINIFYTMKQACRTCGEAMELIEIIIIKNS